MKNYFKHPVSVLLSAILFPALTFLGSSCVQAEEKKSSKIEEIVIVSSKIEQPLREVGTSISVLTEADIALTGSNSLADVLRTLPAVNVSNSGGAGKSTTLRIRGEEGYRTLVLIDGMNVSDVSTPQTSVQIDQVMSNGIGRVEVLRGPQGMIYGADAGGVIDISTVQLNDGFSGSVGGEAGRYGTQQLSGQIGVANKSTDFYLSAADYKTDGFNASSFDLNPADEDGYDNSSYHARLTIRPEDNWLLKAVLRKTSGENQYDNCFNVSNDCANHYDQFNKLIGVDYENKNFSQELSFQQNDVVRENFSDGLPSFDYTSEVNKISYIANLEIAKSLAILFGADYKEEHFESTFDLPKERNQIGYLAEFQAEFFEQLYVNLGVRRDDNDSVGEFTSYRLTAAKVLSFDDFDLKLKSSASSGFRAPSLYEIASNNGPFASSPATDKPLKEETSEGYDAGIEIFFNQGLHVDVVYFDQKTEDKIYYDNVSFSGYLQDDGSSRSKGIEAVIELPITQSVTLNTNYTRNIAEQADGSLRIRRPKTMANVQLSARLFGEKLLFNASWRYSGRFDDIGGVSVDSYRVANTSAHLYIIDGLDIYCRIENVFDNDYVEVPGYNTMGRSGYLGVKYHFNR
ncbi:MAG: TonB-dependent receptor plug domain-containing protein [Cellvibrionaceae bacterium]